MTVRRLFFRLLFVILCFLGVQAAGWYSVSTKLDHLNTLVGESDCDYYLYIIDCEENPNDPSMPYCMTTPYGPYKSRSAAEEFEKLILMEHPITSDGQKVESYITCDCDE
jgi:hypothetical protein